MGTRYLELEHGKLAYELQGSEPLVVCAPSLGDVRGEYRFLIPRLVAEGYQVANLDLRGHGDSSVGWPEYSVAACGNDLIALIRALDAGPATIIGTSVAAAASVYAAAEAPQWVSGVVLIGPVVHGNSSWWDRLLYGALLARPWGPMVWKRYYSSLFPTRKPTDFEAYVAALQTNLGQAGRMEALRGLTFTSKDDSEARLSRVKAPALVVMGTHDPDFKNPTAEAQWVASRLNAPWHMITGAGHYPHAEMPEITGPLILSFLKSSQVQGVPVEAERAA